MRFFPIMISPIPPKKISSRAYLLAPCALLALGAFARELPLPRPLSAQVIRFGGAAAARDARLLLSQTMVVKTQKSAGSTLLRSRLEAAGITARAPMAGQIARVLVREGQAVNVNDRVLQISARGENLVDPGAQRAQSRAESAQVAAAQDQSALQTRMGSARERLAQSQARVARARERVLAAQRIVENLKNGTAMEAPTAPETPVARQAKPDAGEARREIARAGSAASKAVAQAEKSAAVAASAKSVAASAKGAADAAQDAARDAKKAAKPIAPKRSSDGDAANKNAATPTDSTKPKAVESDSNAAAVAARAAQAAREKAERLQDEARAAQRLAQRDQDAATAAKRAKNTLNVPLFGDADETKKPSESLASTRKSGADAPRVSIADAARLVQSAQKESAAAIAQASKLKREVDRYDNQVTDTQQRMESSGKKMEDAQQRLMNSTIRASLSVVRAPTSGTVLWVAPLASEVASGQPLVTVGSRRRLRVNFEDKSGAWKSLRQGATLTALAYPATKNAATATAQNGASVSVKVEEIEAPRRAGEAATITGVVDAKASGSVKLGGGMLVVVSLDVPGTRSVMMVPSSAIRRGENGEEIAVLQPQSEASPVDASASTRNDAAEQDEWFRVEWRRVVTGKNDGVRHEVKTGIAPGERIVLQPETLGEGAASSLVRLARS